MVTRRTFLGGLVGAAIAPAVLRAEPTGEPEFLKERLASGSLPPMAGRIPARPRDLEGLKHSIVSDVNVVKVET